MVGSRPRLVRDAREAVGEMPGYCGVARHSSGGANVKSLLIGTVTAGLLLSGTAPSLAAEWQTYGNPSPKKYSWETFVVKESGRWVQVMMWSESKGPGSLQCFDARVTKKKGRTKFLSGYLIFPRKYEYQKGFASSLGGLTKLRGGRVKYYDRGTVNPIVYRPDYVDPTGFMRTAKGRCGF